MRGWLIVGALALAGCGGEPALARYHEQALAVTAQYAPQVDALVGRGQRLVARLDAVPASVAGQAALATRLAAAAAALGTLRGTITGLPAATADAIAGGRRSEVVARVTGTSSDVATEVVRLADELGTLEREVAALEVQAKALAAPPAPTGETPPAPTGAAPPAPTGDAPKPAVLVPIVPSRQP